MRRALAIDEASFGPDHPDVATDLNNLAVLAASHEPPPRRPSRSIAARWRSTRRASGRIIPTSRRDLNNLAHLLQATNRLAEAEPLYRRALAIGEASFGPDHPTVADPPQQSRAIAASHEPPRRGRAQLSRVAITGSGHHPRGDLHRTVRHEPPGEAAARGWRRRGELRAGSSANGETLGRLRRRPEAIVSRRAAEAEPCQQRDAADQRHEDDQQPQAGAIRVVQPPDGDGDGRDMRASATIT